MIDRDLFACPCCGENRMRQTTLDMLTDAQNYAGLTFSITSGFRCWEYNGEAGGIENSAHLDGWGADILTETSYERFKIITSLYRAGFERFVIYDDIVHVDNDPSKPQEVIALDD